MNSYINAQTNISPVLQALLSLCWLMGTSFLGHSASHDNVIAHSKMTCNFNSLLLFPWDLWSSIFSTEQANQFSFQSFRKQCCSAIQSSIQLFKAAQCQLAARTPTAKYQRWARRNSKLTHYSLTLSFFPAAEHHLFKDCIFLVIITTHGW